MTALLTLLPVLIWVVLIVAAVINVVRLLRYWLHPLRILTTALDNTFMLIVAAVLLPLPFGAAIPWWLLLLGTLIGIVVATIRVSRPAPPIPTVPDTAAAEQEASPRQMKRQEKKRHKAAKRARRPAIAEIVVSSVLAAAALAAAVVAG